MTDEKQLELSSKDKVAISSLLILGLGCGGASIPEVMCLKWKIAKPAAIRHHLRRITSDCG